MDVSGVAASSIGTDASLSGTNDDGPTGSLQPGKPSDGPQLRNTHYDPDRPVDPKAIQAVRDAFVAAGLIEPSTPKGNDSTNTLTGFDKTNPGFASPPPGLAGPPAAVPDNTAISIAPTTPTDRLGGGFAQNVAIDNTGDRGSSTNLADSNSVAPIGQRPDLTVSVPTEGEIPEVPPGSHAGASISVNTPFGSARAGFDTTYGKTNSTTDASFAISGKTGNGQFTVDGDDSAIGFQSPYASGDVRSDGTVSGKVGGDVPVSPIGGVTGSAGVTKPNDNVNPTTVDFDAGIRVGPPGLNIQIGGHVRAPIGGTDDAPPGNPAQPGGGTNSTSSPNDFPNTPPPGTGTDSGTTPSPDDFPNSPPPGTGSKTASDSAPRDFPDTPPPGTKTDKADTTDKPEPKTPKHEGGENRGQQRDTTPSEDRDFGGSASDFGGSNGLL